jgi:hypothetical protein
MLRATLIDPHLRSVSQVELPDEPGGHDLAARIGCELIETVPLQPPRGAKPGVMLVVDDEGLAKEGQRFWAFDVHPDRIFAGPALVLAQDDEGEPVDNPVDLDLITPRVLWKNVRFVGFRQLADEPGDELMFTVRIVPIFEPAPEH